MELLEEILKFSIGGITIVGAMVFIGKLILTKSSELLIENHKNRLEISKTEHQVKFTKLHTERGEIIKQIYQDFYDLEQKLEFMTTLFQGAEWKNEKQREELAIAKYREVYNRLENNRIYFSEELCEQLTSALESYYEIIKQMLNAKSLAGYESNCRDVQLPDGQGSLDLWKDAENKTKNEIRNLRLELAKVFRSLIGV